MKITHYFRAGIEATAESIARDVESSVNAILTIIDSTVFNFAGFLMFCTDTEDSFEVSSENGKYSGMLGVMTEKKFLFIPIRSLKQYEFIDVSHTEMERLLTTYLNTDRTEMLTKINNGDIGYIQSHSQKELS